MDYEDLPCLRGRIGVVLAATKQVCAISVQVDAEPSLILALGDLVYSGVHRASNLKRLENAKIKFDAIRDNQSPFGSFWKAIHAWTDAKIQNTDPIQDWIELKPKYQDAREDLLELFSTYKRLLIGFLLKGMSLEDHLLSTGNVHDYLQSLGKKDANAEKKAIQFYVNLIEERNGAIDCSNAHSFLHARADIRIHLKSKYQLSNLNDFFANHPKYFLVEESDDVSIQPVWFLTTLQFPVRKVLNSAQSTAGSSSSATNANESHKAGSSSSTTNANESHKDHQKVKRAVATILRSVVLSAKGGIPLQKLQDEYVAMVGKAIPYQESGYSSLESMLAEMQDVVHLTRSAGAQILVTAVKNPTTDHLANLIKHQKGIKPSISRRRVKRRTKISSQALMAVKACVPALERKTIYFFAKSISNKRHSSQSSGQQIIINAKKAQELITKAEGDVQQYVTSTYGDDLQSLFLRYPECFHVTKTGNIFPRGYKKIAEFVNMNTFGFEATQRSKKSSDPVVGVLPTPLSESPFDSRSVSSYGDSDSLFSAPVSWDVVQRPSPAFHSEETSKGESQLLIDTLKNFLRNSESFASTEKTSSCLNDFFQIETSSEDADFPDLVDLSSSRSGSTLSDVENVPRTRDIACQTISTGPILSLSIYNL